MEVPYRGPVYNTVLDLLGGMRSACTYVGCAGVAELLEKTTFVRCQQQANYVYGNKHWEYRDHNYISKVIQMDSK